MQVTNASEFLSSFGRHFAQPQIRDMVWSASDDDFGRIVELPLDRGPLMVCIATFDLQSNCCTMTVTERDLSDEAAHIGDGTTVAMTSLIVFDDHLVQIDDNNLELSDESVRLAIAKFNELAV